MYSRRLCTSSSLNVATKSSKRCATSWGGTNASAWKNFMRRACSASSVNNPCRERAWILWTLQWPKWKSSPEILLQGSWKKELCMLPFQSLLLPFLRLFLIAVVPTSEKYDYTHPQICSWLQRIPGRQNEVRMLRTNYEVLNVTGC